MPMIAMAMFVSQAGAQTQYGNCGMVTGAGVNYYCNYNAYGGDPASCWDIQNQYANSGSITCQQDSSQPGCGDCNEKIENCKRDGGLFSGTPSGAVGSNKTCASLGLTQVGGVENCGKWCLWATGCTGITTDPTGQYNDGNIIATCAEALAACEKDSEDKILHNESTCGGTPILKVNHAAGLIVAAQGRALHISSDKKATVNLYTLAGQQVLSGSVQAGNSVFSLMGQNPGVYYAVVQSGSYTQTVNVVLK
ncbi:MAG: T9SS type A sorting domain-containing protein [Fibromonadales bacterium]|nr:T9SS type A sorting domain-containing protein [Fibromonadales bacterium]